MIAQRLLISGRVQGVGYRDWMIGEATRLGVHGWVRNVGAGRVEAMVQGGTDEVAQLVRLCHVGPGPARVEKIDVASAERIAANSFSILPSA